jgi:hypothetical protein
MRSLSSTLLTAQKQAAGTPYIRVEAKNEIAGVVRPDWARLYEGSEDDYFHALTIPGDGSLIRVRIALPGDSRKLYRQRVADPGPESDFSQWTYCNQYNCVVAAAASLGAEVSLFWINSSREIRRIKSTDNGASWGSPELIGYSPSTAIRGIAAAYKPNGDLAIFFADQAVLYVKKHVGGDWQTSVAWGETVGDLSGVATIYDNDWNLFVTGQDTDDNYKLWSLIYGDGGDVSPGTWSELKEFASAPSGGDFEYCRTFMDKPDVYRGFYIEKFTGTEGYNRPFWSHSIPGTGFLESLWREPVPFDLSSGYGLAIAHHGDYCWLSSPSGVWRASLTVSSLDLTNDVVSLRQEMGKESGKVAVHLRNDNGKYASPGEEELAVLDIGAQLEVSPGYVTPAGKEVSTGFAFQLGAFEYTGSEGKAGLVLYAGDGWDWLENWVARHQFRWNKDSDQMSVKQIMEFVLARVGLKLEVKSQSSVITGYYPDFAIHPNNRGDDIIRRLLSFVPDVLFIEGNEAYLVNPQSSDGSVYAYGLSHPIFEGRYRSGAWALNRVQVDGYDTGGDVLIVVDSFSWAQVNRLYDRLRRVEDRNIGTVAGAGERGEAYLREAEIEAGGGVIRVPVNCGQQLYDVVGITDSRAGLNADKRRVLGLTLVYNPQRGEYEERLVLGTV